MFRKLFAQQSRERNSRIILFPRLHCVAKIDHAPDVCKRTDQQGSISDKRPSGNRPKRLTAKMAQPPILIGACPTFPFPLQKK